MLKSQDKDKGQDFVIKPVGPANWKDFESLFESKGTLNNCWCMAWRMTKEELKDNNPAKRKSLMKGRVWAGTPIGLLAYADSRPVGWCSIAPRETHERLGGEESLEGVWSITCFYIEKDFRDRGLIHLLIQEAGRYAAENGAKYLEAYPVDPDSPSYRNMGFVVTFEKEGFHHVKDAGTRRHVMVRKL